MTRSERLAQSTARAAQRTAKAKAAEAKARAKERANAKETLEKRCVQVGHLAHEAGLLAWENSTLGHLFTLLAELLDTPGPVGVLESLLHSGADALVDNGSPPALTGAVATPISCGDGVSPLG